MANKKRLSRELASLETIILYRDYLTSIAQNTIEFDNLPSHIDADKVNYWLIVRGAVAWFKDEVLNEYYILPFKATGNVDLYGNPTTIQVFSSNGYTKQLKAGEYVIIYDNTLKKSIYPSICQYAERLALNRRIEDINIFNQKTPKIWQCSREQEQTLRQIIQSLDTFTPNIVVSDNLDYEQLTAEFNPVPFVADKINDNTAKIFGEFLQMIGITSISIEKRERLISSEVSNSQGGALVSRMARVNSRQEAIAKINAKYNQNIEVKFYEEDPLIQDFLERVDNMGGGSDVVTQSNDSTGD